MLGPSADALSARVEMPRHTEAVSRRAVLFCTKTTKAGEGPWCACGGDVLTCVVSDIVQASELMSLGPVIGTAKWRS